MNLPENRFKRALAEGRQQIGLWNSIPGPLVSELLAGCGFDWLTIDTEHSLTDIPDTLAMLQAMAPYPVAPVVRPAANDVVLIKRILDLGAQTLMIPQVNSVAEAAAAVAAIRYPPRGIRGVAGMTRASRYGRVEGYAARSDEELCLILQIETREALDALEAIAAVDGVDALFIGPADLAASLGHPGQSGHPEVVAAIEDAIGRARQVGKPIGILTLDPAFAKTCIGWGTSFTAVGLDLSVLSAGARRLAADFR